MAAIIRKGDSCSGHGSYPPRSTNSGSSNVLVNGKGVHRVGDSWPSHSSSEFPYPSHSGSASSGSSTVFANGKAICRNGDLVSCGSTMTGGSGNVFAG